MPISQKLCVVEDTYTITGRGLVVMTKEWQPEQVVTRGQQIELRSGTGQRRTAQVKSLDSVRRFGEGGAIGLCLVGVSRETVRAGDEIWSLGSAD